MVLHCCLQHHWLYLHWKGESGSYFLIFTTIFHSNGILTKWYEFMITPSTWNCLWKSIFWRFLCFSQLMFCDKNKFNTLNVFFLQYWNMSCDLRIWELWIHWTLALEETSRFIVPPIPLHDCFPWLVAKNTHLASML